MKQKINLRLFLIAIIAIVATAVSITTVYYGLFQKQVRTDLSVSAKLLKDTRYFESEDIDISQIDLSTDIDELRVTWVSADGTVIYDNDNEASDLANHSDRPEIQEAFLNGVGESVRRSDTMNENTYYYAVLLDNGTVLRVAVNARSAWSVLFSVLPLILLIILAIVALCIILSHYLTQQLIRPIEKMAENIEDSTVATPYKELVPFANRIRSQHADILSAVKMRQEFTANVSHELKTPLTAISGYAELMENGMVDEAGQKHFAQEIRKNATRLLSLINDIIRLSDLDRADNIISFEELDLYETVGECIEALSVNAKGRGINLYFDGEKTRIRANKEMIRELTDNLVENAIKYNNEGGNVWVTVGKNEGSAFLQVKDDGIGIPPEDQSHIFERFYRVDKSRSKATGGTGLGLAIVKHIVDIHAAKLELKSELSEGTCISIRF